jgi:HEAT repeat protein
VIERACLPAADDLSPETFDEIRSVAEWKRGAPDVRALAVRALAERFSRARIAPVLDRVIETAGGFTRDSAIEVALAIHHRPELELLLSIVLFAPPRTAQLIAASLAWYQDERVEPALIDLLSREEKSVRLAAIEALARIGTRVAVEPLLRIADGIHSSDLRTSARAAIDRIQARMGPTDRGELSIIEADDQAGALSVPSEEPGALSVP